MLRDWTGLRTAGTANSNDIGFTLDMVQSRLVMGEVRANLRLQLLLWCHWASGRVACALSVIMLVWSRRNA